MYVRLLCCGFLLLLLFSPASATELYGRVSWIYDGDTLLVEKIGKVRLLGIDTPESKDSQRDRYYLKQGEISRQKLRKIARQAKMFNIKLVKGAQVRLVFDVTETDQYQRKLAYLYLPDGRMLNRLLLQQGLASTFRRYQFSYKEEFLALEATARQQQLGLWQQQR